MHHKLFYAKLSFDIKNTDYLSLQANVLDILGNVLKVMFKILFFFKVPMILLLAVVILQMEALINSYNHEPFLLRESIF